MSSNSPSGQIMRRDDKQWMGRVGVSITDNAYVWGKVQKIPFV